ncbi:heme NO-binding domain-containing protein [Marinoscillum sp.]|uniref:heme NO-binding domain-containing protein n=1 Tax=Marinoscillum sp. TaxID=2024838 RepID=UPI003BA8486F
MKGIVFTEFLEMVESHYGLEMVNDIIAASQLESSGAYTSVGTYDFAEMQQLITNLSVILKKDPNDLIYVYGKYFFDHLTQTYPHIFDHYKSAVLLLQSVEEHIHVQVVKIYPDAELPRFDISEVKDGRMEMIYTSSRALYMFAYALIEKTFGHYETVSTITYEKLKEDGTCVKFIIQLE